MFLWLLLVTLAVAALVSFGVARAFADPIRKILDRLVSEALAPAWARYVRFAVIVVGVSGGVRIHQLERYVGPANAADPLWAVDLDANRWVLEIYGTLIGTLQSIAWLLLVFFLFALIAYVLVRGFELRHQRRTEDRSA
jgi:hypothetical protein